MRRKTTVEIDDELVQQVARILGTGTITWTIHCALKEVIAAHARRALVDRLGKMEGLDLADPDVMRQAWGE